MTRRGESPDPSARRDGPDGKTDEAVERMRRAVAAAARGGGAPTELEAAAIQLVTELRAENHPPEQMLLRIKQLLADAGVRPSYATSSELEAPTVIEATLYRDVIAWSIRYYYGSDGR